jgi:hypothetical protein
MIFAEKKKGIQNGKRMRKKVMGVRLLPEVGVKDGRGEMELRWTRKRVKRIKL